MGVEFEKNSVDNYNYQTKKGGISSWVIKSGLAKNEAGAGKILIGISVVFIIIAVYLVLK